MICKYQLTLRIFPKLEYKPKNVLGIVLLLSKNYICSGFVVYINENPMHISLAFPKVGKDASLPSSYRPISLLSCLSKVIESVIKYKVNDFILKFNIIPRFQFGFR